MPVCNNGSRFCDKIVQQWSHRPVRESAAVSEITPLLPVRLTLLGGRAPLLNDLFPNERPSITDILSCSVKMSNVRKFQLSVSKCPNSHLNHCIARRGRRKKLGPLPPLRFLVPPGGWGVPSEIYRYKAYVSTNFKV